MITEKFKINLQLFPEGGEGGTGGEQNAEGFFKFFDPESKKEILVPEKIKAGDQEIDMRVIMGHLNSGIRKSVSKDIEARNEKRMKELNDLLANKETTTMELQKKLQEFEDEKLSAEDRAKVAIERERAKFQNDLKKHQEEAVSWRTQFQNERIDNAILGSLPASVYNPSQTMLLIKSLLKPELIANDKGGFDTVLSITIDGEEQKLPPKEAIEKFLAMPGNEHHLKNNLNPGAGTSGNGGRALNGGLAYKRSEVASNPKIRQEYSSKLMKGENVSLID